MSPIDTLFAAAPVMAVVTIESEAAAIPLGRALVDGRIPLIEVTLRTPAALDAIREIKAHVPGAIVGAGTVLTPQDLEAATRAGAAFAVSPGATRELLEAGRASSIPFLPGVATASEIMTGLAMGYERFKFFPAESAGGVPALRALAAPLPAARFCPTGGITIQNAAAYLALPNVGCIGGSWLAPPDLIAAKAFGDITIRARAARALRP